MVELDKIYNETMKTIYISGPITDTATGQPRNGWQKDFLAAEAKLRQMGFLVINPVDIARDVEDDFAYRWECFPNSYTADGKPIPPSRADYIMACLARMKMSYTYCRLDGVYVIGDKVECCASHGVQMELLFAEVLHVPIFAEYCVDCRVDHNIVAVPGGGVLEELIK